MQKKIILKKQELPPTTKRTTVVIKPHTYTQIKMLAAECNMPIETLVEQLLTEALKWVEVEE